MSPSLPKSLNTIGQVEKFVAGLLSYQLRPSSSQNLQQKIYFTGKWGHGKISDK